MNLRWCLKNCFHLWAIKTVGLLVVTSNKGLAGAYNANIVRRTLQIIKDYKEQGIDAKVFIVGQKGISSLKRKAQDYNFEITKTYLGAANNPSAEAAKIIIPLTEVSTE